MANDIRRGRWQAETINKIASVGPTSRRTAKPVELKQPGVSNSEYALRNRSATAPEALIAAGVKSGVSEHRLEELSRGAVRSGQSSFPFPVLVNSNSYKQTQDMLKQYGGLAKQGGVSTSGSGAFGNPGGADVVRMPPEVYSPLFQIANLQLPRDRVTMNAWNRNFYDTHPLVHNCINLHATYPIGKINIRCHEPKVEEFFNRMIEEIDLVNVLQSISLEIWQLGEAFPYCEMDSARGTWKNISIINPDQMIVNVSMFGDEVQFLMKPDLKLKQLVSSTAPEDIKVRQTIPEEIVYRVRRGENIPIDSMYLSHLKLLARPYDTRGTSPIVSIYKDLILYDKLRESKYAQADSLVNPITVCTLGGSTDGDYRATQEELENFRQIMEAAQYDKDYKIISHAGVKIERVGASGQVIDIANDVTTILDNILYGLMVPKAVITQDGASYNSASIGLEVLKQRYEGFRNMIAKWLVKKVFAPISEIQEFYEYKGGKKNLIVPEVQWNQMILFDMDNYIGHLKELATNPENQTVSKETFFKSLGLNMEEEKRKIKKEMIDKAIATKEQQILQKMSLGALRALKPSDDIIEQTSELLPGVGLPEEGAEGALPELGGLPPELGLGGGGGGGAPPLSPPETAPEAPAAPAPTTTPPAGGPAPTT